MTIKDLSGLEVLVVVVSANLVSCIVIVTVAWVLRWIFCVADWSNPNDKHTKILELQKLQKLLQESSAFIGKVSQRKRLTATELERGSALFARINKALNKN